jgi:site-specific DNA recombinase
LYARVSTNLQEKEQTIQSQLAAVMGYAEQHGLRHSPALTYTDDGYSGTWLDRPALDELRDHAREGRFDIVIVLCPDRLARRYAYQVLLLEELKRAGIDVLFCERPIDDSPDDQLLLQIQGAIAEYERAKLLERCRRGRLHRARRGELSPPSTPYGYTYAARKYGGDGQIRIDEDEAAMVRQTFAWYVEEGASLYGVAQRLNGSTTWKPRRGARWTGAIVLRILRCEWYVGRAYYNRTTRRPRDARDPGVVEGASVKSVVTERPRSEWITVPVPRIIEDGLFARVQQRIVENRRFCKRRQKRNVYLLKGLIKCGVCGYAYAGFVQTARPWYRYYLCTQREPAALPDGTVQRCTNKAVRGEGVDEVVWTTVRDLLLDDHSLAEQLRSWLERTTAEASENERMQLATGRLNELKRQRGRLIDAYQSGALDLEDFRTRKTTVEERILTVEHELAELRSWATKRELATRQVASAEAVVQQLRQRLDDPSFETKQAILRLVLDKVVVVGRRLELHLALPVSGGIGLTYTRVPKRQSDHNQKVLCSRSRNVWSVEPVRLECHRRPSRSTRRADSTCPDHHSRTPGRWWLIPTTFMPDSAVEFRWTPSPCYPLGCP